MTRSSNAAPERYPARRGASAAGRGPSPSLTVLMILLAAYIVLPLAWVLVNSTKSEADLFTSFGLWFSDHFDLWSNIVETFSYNGGEFARWYGNTLLYVAVGATGATIIATLGGYGLAKFAFRGRSLLLAGIVAAIAIPGAALAVPTYLLFIQWGLTDTIWGVIIPTLVSPFGLYIMWSFAKDAVPAEIIEAARVDGAGEFRIFFTIVFRLLAPGTTTVFLLTVAGVWNNFFLPLITLNDTSLYPLIVGLSTWNAQASLVNSEAIHNLVITGSLLTVLPVIVIFLVFQRYWRANLTAGSIK